MASRGAMVVGVGIDLVEVDRVRALAERHRAHLERVLAPSEMHLCFTDAAPYLRLAACFAVKEAVFKALGSGWSTEVVWTDVVSSGVDGGQVMVSLRGGARRVATRLGVRNIRVALACTPTLVLAQALLEGAADPQPEEHHE